MIVAYGGDSGFSNPVAFKSVFGTCIVRFVGVEGAREGVVGI